MLFKYDKLRYVEKSIKDQIRNKMEGLDFKIILYQDKDILLNNFIEIYSIEKIIILEKYIKTEIKENYVFKTIPFIGESYLFNCRPSIWETYYPSALIKEKELILSYSSNNVEVFNQDFETIKSAVSVLNSDVEKINKTLYEFISKELDRYKIISKNKEDILFQ